MEERHYALPGGQNDIFFLKDGEDLLKQIKSGWYSLRSLTVKDLPILYTGNVCVNK